MFYRGRRHPGNLIAWIGLARARTRGWAGVFAIVPGSCARFPAAHFSQQPSAGGRPTAFYSCWRNAQEFGSIFDGEPAEIAQLHDLALLGIEFCKPNQSFV